MTNDKKFKAKSAIFELTERKTLTAEDFEQLAKAIDSIPEDEQENKP